MRLDRLYLLRSLLAAAPFVERDPAKAVVAGAHKTEKAESENRGAVFHTRGLRQDVLHLVHHLIGALQRSGVRELQVQIEEALVFIGYEAVRNPVADKVAGRAAAHQKQHSHYRSASQNSRNANVALVGTRKHAIKPSEEDRQRPPAFLSRLQDQRSQ